MKIVNDTIQMFPRQQVLAETYILKITNVRILHFYITPKIHNKGVPGDCDTSKLSKFVNRYNLQKT